MPTSLLLGTSTAHDYKIPNIKVQSEEKSTKEETHQELAPVCCQEGSSVAVENPPPNLMTELIHHWTQKALSPFVLGFWCQEGG